MALSEIYKQDKLSPGILTSWLPEKQMYYASVQRFELNGDRSCILKAEGSTLHETMCNLAEQWRSGNVHAIQFMQGQRPKFLKRRIRDNSRKV